MTATGVFLMLAFVIAASYQLGFKTGWARGYAARKAGQPDPQKDRPYIGGSEC